MSYSKEDASLIQFMKNSGTAFTPPSPQQINEGTHVNGSYHYRLGTNGRGLAIDFVGPSLSAIFDTFAAQGPSHYAELIWDNPHAQNRNVKNGKWTPIYDHAPNAANHIHVAVNVGTFLDQLNHPVPPQGVKPMFDPPLQVAAVCEFFSKKTQAKAIAMLAPDGAVYCEPPEAYQGGANGPDFATRKAAKIKDNNQGGYVITATSGEKYSYPEGTNPNV